MRIGTETSAWNVYGKYVNLAENSRTAQTTAPRQNTASTAASSATNITSANFTDYIQGGVHIDLRQYDESSGVSVSGSYFAGQSTAGKFAGVGSVGMRKYMGTGDTSLAAMNANRKNLGGRIDSLIRAAGITLGKDEKLTISVDGKNTIVVGGIKDKEKAKAIQEALNNDKVLGREMRKHVATAKIAEYAKQEADYQKSMKSFGLDPVIDLGENTADSFTNRGMRAFVIEEYLQENAGIGLSDLSVETGADGTVSILGMTSELNSLLSEDPDLAATIANILENGENATPHAISFEFANGAISDSATDAAARTKVDEIKEKLLGRLNMEADGAVQGTGVFDNFLEEITNAGGKVDEKLAQMLSRGFSIRIAANGDFEIVGADDLDDKYKQKLKQLVQKGLDDWAAANGSEETFTGGTRTATFADVAQTFIEQHRFEHGDVDQYEHMLQINLGGGSSDMKVVSPEADKAQDEENQGTADELGKELKNMLSENGIDAAGLEFEMDDSGKITVLGDPDNGNVRHAQQLIDMFVEETKNTGGRAAKTDNEEKAKADLERHDIRNGKTRIEDADYTPDGFAARDLVATPAEKVEEEKRFAKESKVAGEAFERIKNFLPDPTLQSEQSARLFATYLSWQRIMPKNVEGTLFLGGVENVSMLRAPQYASPSAQDGERYAGDAGGLYLKLLDGMGQFHDGRRGSKYTFAA